MDRIHVFLGTKAQYIKTAPLLRLMDERGIDYRLVDSGQHAALAERMRAELGVRPPDHRLGGTRDIDSIPQALAWSLKLGAGLLSRRRCADVFGGDRGICVVHGDTPSTLLSTLIARRAGLRVAHLEAGLRSGSVLHPFPEEAIRIAVMRLAHILFAPDDPAERNLERMGLAERTVRLPANTVVESLAHALGEDPGLGGGGPAIMTMHRVENLHRAERVRGFVSLALRIAEQWPVTVVVHGPTRPVLERHGVLERLEQAGVSTTGLVSHDAFARMCHAAPFVVTDGGSIQEECALLGVPTLLWRQRTERPDGLGRNVVLSGHDLDVARRFLADLDDLRSPPADLTARPSLVALEALLGQLTG